MLKKGFSQKLILIDFVYIKSVKKWVFLLYIGYLGIRDIESIHEIQIESCMMVYIYFLVSRFRCPKGWKRLGGSCYYLSNLTSISTEANHTCNRLHSNYSNIMQIRNTVELFYAAHVLSRRNLSALMIDIDPSLLKGERMFLFR
jgi:hypothetical protein